MYTLQYQKPHCHFLPLLLHSFTYPMLPSVTKYVLFSSNRVGVKSLEMYTVGPLNIAKAPIEHILPSVKLKANFDGQIIIYQESTDCYLASDNLIALPQSPFRTNGKKITAMPKNSIPSSIMATKYLNRVFLVFEYCIRWYHVSLRNIALVLHGYN